mgnify:FL=1
MQLIVALLSASCLVWIFKKYSRKSNLSAKILFSAKHAAEHESPAHVEKTNIEPGKLNYAAINRSYRVADMHFSRGDFHEAEKWLIKVLALHEYHPEALNKLGVIYIHNGNSKKAELIFRKLLSITQKEPIYYCNYGRCLYTLGRLDDAIGAYENAIKLDSTKPARFTSIGQIYYEQKHYEKALEYFLKALELDPDNLEYLKLIAELSKLMGDDERLHQTLKKIEELDPYSTPTD